MITVCHISTFAPTQCGIATYTGDLIANLFRCDSIQLRMAFSLNDLTVDPADSELTLAANAASDREYSTAAEIINNSCCNLVSLQHEFGIFGGSDGEYIATFVEGLKKPLVTTLHTVSPVLSQHKIRILDSLVRCSKRIIVLSDEDASVLTSLVDCPINKIEVIRHGVPETRFSRPADSEIRRLLNASLVFVSAGHVRPAKGYHLALCALQHLKQTHKNFKYLILGRTQQQYEYGSAYREEIRELVKELGLSEHIIWLEEYLPLSQLIGYIKAADIGLVTYTDEYQASSGVLPLMLSLARPVVATSFAYAVRMAHRTPGIHLTSTNDPKHLC